MIGAMSVAYVTANVVSTAVHPISEEPSIAEKATTGTVAASQYGGSVTLDESVIPRAP